MSKTKHTPGPWKLCAHLSDHDQCSCGYRGGIWGADGSVIVCEMGGPVGCEGDDMIPRSPRETQYSDARLIAAAPELLAVAKAALAFIDCHVADPDITEEMVSKYNALRLLEPHEVIAKATGAA